MKEKLFKALTEGSARAKDRDDTLRRRLDAWYECEDKPSLYVTLKGRSEAALLTINLEEPQESSFTCGQGFNPDYSLGLEGIQIATQEMQDCCKVAEEVRNILTQGEKKMDLRSQLQDLVRNREDLPRLSIERIKADCIACATLGQSRHNFMISKGISEHQIEEFLAMLRMELDLEVTVDDDWHDRIVSIHW
jgi:hypothetical protein